MAENVGARLIQVLALQGVEVRVLFWAPFKINHLRENQITKILM